MILWIGALPACQPDKLSEVAKYLIRKKKLGIHNKVLQKQDHVLALPKT